MYKAAITAISELLRDNAMLLQCNQMMRSPLHVSAAQLPRPLAPGHEEPQHHQQLQLQQPDNDDNNVERAEEMRLVHLPIDFKLHRLELGPDKLVTLKQREATEYYRQLFAIRRLEVAAAQLYKEKLVRGFCHLYTGQEACAVGLCAAMRPEDNLIAGYRIHGLAYLMGISAARVLAELLGRSSGCARGKGGSMHMYAPRFYGGNGIVGAQISLGTGIALTNKYRQNGGVCLALYGDGAANQGQAFECFNMAHLWKLPIVFVCENNNYGMGTGAWRASSNTNYYTRGDFLPGLWVDGQDVLAVRSATRFALNYAEHRGPLILELSTYRYAGHSMSDPGTSYRAREEIQEVRRRQDALTRFRTLCLEHSLLTKSQLPEIEERVRLEINAAIKLAKSDPELPISDLCSDIYSGNDVQNVRGICGQNLEHGKTAK